MAHTLAELHRVMAAIPIGDVGPVAALEIGDAYQLPVQLLHGDFSAANIRLHDGQARVFDFDDCGSGPVQFDVANTLYMVMFDATVTGNPGRYERFREWFVDAYRSATGRSMDDALLDTMIELRRDALRFWIDHLDEAPTGIRTSSPDWIAVLRRFTHRAT
jgi:Ser/Thr protein kinase RdoA (MazF antagonist)